MVTFKHHARASVSMVAAVLFLSSCNGRVQDVAQHPGEEREMAGHGHIHHEIDYIEIGVIDLARSKRFYAEAFGWEFNDYGPAYAGIRKRQGGEIGGLREESSVTAGGPLVILYSQDLETTITRVRDAGGTITQEIFEFPGGRRFHFSDPSGNELGVWSDN
jgi:uncharacterized protein